MKTVKLRSGATMPLNGFGTNKGKATLEASEAAIIAALDTGYRHFDCAAVYCNEPTVGKAFSSFFGRGEVSREEVFITSKVWNTCHRKDDVVAACRQSLKDLQLEHLDLYLVHHPYSWKFLGLPITKDTFLPRNEKGHIELGGASLLETWRGMEECLRLGLVKDIGVSNYSAALIVDLMNYCEIKPSVNQCEAHVYNTRPELRSVCNMYDIHYTMYSILGSGKQGPLQDGTVAAIAKQHNTEPAQVMIAWGLAKGCSVLSKSVTPSRIKENFESEKISLSDQDIEALDELDRKQIVCNMMNTWGFPSHV